MKKSSNCFSFQAKQFFTLVKAKSFFSENKTDSRHSIAHSKPNDLRSTNFFCCFRQIQFLVDDLTNLLKNGAALAGTQTTKTFPLRSKFKKMLPEVKKFWVDCSWVRRGKGLFWVHKRICQHISSNSTLATQTWKHCRPNFSVQTWAWTPLFLM